MVFDGICFSIVGKTSSILSPQASTVGTSWRESAVVVSSCSANGCNCLNNITINNLGASTESITYLRCGLSGSGNVTTETIAGGGTSFISGTNGCANVNSMVLSKTQQGLLSSINFDFSSSIHCT